MNQQKTPRRGRGATSGQALVEYAMLMIFILGVYTAIDYQIRKSIGNLWTAMAKDIAAGCPGCEPPESIH